MKYIIVKNLGLELPIVFNEIIEHSRIAENWENKVISAGFCSIHAKDSVMVHGSSRSLNINSRPEDAKIISDSLIFCI